MIFSLTLFLFFFIFVVKLNPFSFNLIGIIALAQYINGLSKASEQKLDIHWYETIEGINNTFVVLKVDK